MCQSTIVLQLLKPKSKYPMSCQLLVLAGSCDSFLVRKSTPVEILGDDRHTGTMFGSDLIALPKTGSLSKSLFLRSCTRATPNSKHFDTYIGNITYVPWEVLYLANTFPIVLQVVDIRQDR